MRRKKVTKEIKRIDLPTLDGFHCFACGSHNPIGLHMSFYLEDDTVCSDIILNENHAGWDSVAHGGIVTTLLDEVMSWTVLVLKRTFVVTRTIEVKFLRPVQLNVPLVVKGTLKSMPNDSRCTVTGTLFDSKGKRLSRASADIADLPEKRLHLISPPLRKEMLRLFKKLEALV